MLDKDFKFKKKFGQNFILDKNFLRSIVNDFDLRENSNVLEIGAGAGTLTEVLAQTYKKVLSVEIDKTLTEHLIELKNNYSNLDFIFDDILKVDIKTIEEYFDNNNYVIIANLPYYITSQIIFKFLYDSTHLDEMYIMVQKEVGSRFCSKSGSKEYGIPSVVISTIGSANIVKNVGRKNFYPVPEVDSCILNIKIDREKRDAVDIKSFSQFVQKCFMMRRKTLMNNLVKQNNDKQKCEYAFAKLKLEQNVRPEQITPEQYVDLYKLISGVWEIIFSKWIIFLFCHIYYIKKQKFT